MTAIRKPPRKEAYHHGDLRAALVAAALTHVRKHGAETFSLREAARDAGVTSGAVYKHFADKDQLLAAVASEGLAILARRMQRATDGLAARERLKATGRAYIDFASAEPRLFHLAFSRYANFAEQFADQRADACETGSGTTPNAFIQLRDAVAAVHGDGRKVDPAVIALAWSVAHGAASLICDGMWTKNDPRAEAALSLALKAMTAR